MDYSMTLTTPLNRVMVCKFLQLYVTEYIKGRLTTTFEHNEGEDTFSASSWEQGLGVSCNISSVLVTTDSRNSPFGLLTTLEKSALSFSKTCEMPHNCRTIAKSTFDWTCKCKKLFVCNKLGQSDKPLEQEGELPLDWKHSKWSTALIVHI